MTLTIKTLEAEETVVTVVAVVAVVAEVTVVAVVAECEITVSSANTICGDTFTDKWTSGYNESRDTFDTTDGV